MLIAFWCEEDLRDGSSSSARRGTFHTRSQSQVPHPLEVCKVRAENLALSHICNALWYSNALRKDSAPSITFDDCTFGSRTVSKPSVTEFFPSMTELDVEAPLNSLVNTTRENVAMIPRWAERPTEAHSRKCNPAKYLLAQQRDQQGFVEKAVNMYFVREITSSALCHCIG